MMMSQRVLARIQIEWANIAIDNVMMMSESDFRKSISRGSFTLKLAIT